MKEALKGKVTKADRYEPNGKIYQDGNGNYYFNVAFDNGDSGSYGTKKDVQTNFIVGQEVEYEKEENGTFQDGTVKWKIRVPKPEWTPKSGGGAKAGWQPKTTKEAKRDIISMTMRYAVDMWIADKIGRAEVKELHKEITSFVWEIMDELENTPDGGTQS